MPSKNGHVIPLFSRVPQGSNKILKRALIAALCVCLLITLLLTTILFTATNPVHRNHNGHKLPQEDRESQSLFRIESHPQKDADATHARHRLGVIIPFRDRYEELMIFAPFIHRFLNLNHIDHDIIVVNQVDHYRFNRASLINVGFQYATSTTSHPDSESVGPCDYIVMHDVDLLPLNKNLPYGYPKVADTVMHVSGPAYHPKYHYEEFIGGVLIVPASIFGLVNGMSNVYWGWGLEDDEFFVRLKQSGIAVARPEGLSTGRNDTFRHVHVDKERPRDYAKCFDQLKKTRRRDRLTGLNNVNYTIESVNHMTIEHAPVVMLNVKLHCNTKISPWCICQSSKTKAVRQKIKPKTKVTEVSQKEGTKT